MGFSIYLQVLADMANSYVHYYLHIPCKQSIDNFELFFMMAGIRDDGDKTTKSQAQEWVESRDWLSSELPKWAIPVSNS